MATVRVLITLIATLLISARVVACDVPGVRLPPAVPAARVLLDTERGEIVIRVDLKKAPVTACNFLKYVAANAYRGGNFGRTVRADNQISASVPIAVIQAYPRQGFQAWAPIALERSRDTGLHHADGTVSMARGAPDDATDEFFICVGSQPELDFGGRRNPDGQGFAAFGKVIRGMEVVLSIQNGGAEGERLRPPATIRSARIVVY